MLLSRIVIAFLPMLVFAQTPAASTPGAPPEVDKALRERVNQFFQYHVDAVTDRSALRKAMDLVAEDTKDEYFASGKMQLKNFEITAIEYSDNFTRAKVETTVTTTWNIRLQEQTSVVPMVTTWKIENGKWVWYNKIQTGSILTPMGESRVDPDINGRNAKKPVPDKLDDATINNRAMDIVKGISVDKRSVILSADNPSSAKVKVHNATAGFIKLSLVAIPDIPGFKASLDKPDVGGNQDATVTIEFNGEAKETRPPFEIRIVADPFNQIFPISVSLGAPQSAK